LQNINIIISQGMQVYLKNLATILTKNIVTKRLSLKYKIIIRWAISIFLEKKQKEKKTTNWLFSKEFLFRKIKKRKDYFVKKSKRTKSIEWSNYTHNETTEIMLSLGKILKNVYKWLHLNQWLFLSLLINCSSFLIFHNIVFVNMAILT
jgi:hypothetical protein